MISVLLLQKGTTIFGWKIFVSQCRKLSSRNLSVFQKISAIEICWGLERGRVSQLFVKIVLSHSTKKLRRGTLRCFRKFLVSKNFMLQRVIARFSVEMFLSHSAEKNFVEEHFCGVFQKFPVAKKFMYKREGKYQDFPSKFFCLTVPKYIVGEPLCFTNFGYRKILCFRGLCHDFLSKFFCLKVTKRNFVEELFCCVFQKFPAAKKIMYKKEGKYQDFPSKIFCLTAAKNFVGEPLCFTNFGYRKILCFRG